MATLGIIGLYINPVTLSVLEAGTPASINYYPTENVSYLHPFERYFLGHRLSNYAPPEFYAPRRYRAVNEPSDEVKKHQRYFGLHASSTNWRYPRKFDNIQ